jgi:hypothetical protein
VKEFYRVSEVMEIINMGRTKTYQLIRAGVIPKVDIDGSIRIPVKLFHEKIETIISTSRHNDSIASQGAENEDSASGHPLHSTRRSTGLHKPTK